MRKQDRIPPRTPEAAIYLSRTDMKKLADSMTLTVENGETTAQIKLTVGDREIPVTVEMTGLVSARELDRQLSALREELGLPAG